MGATTTTAKPRKLRRRLNTTHHIRVAVASACRRLEAGTLRVPLGEALINGYGLLLQVMKHEAAEGPPNGAPPAEVSK